MSGGLHFITVVNAHGALVEFCNLGARWTRCCVPDADGHIGNVLVGTDDYIHDTLYRGALIGRVANRVAHACFELDGQMYYLDANDGSHSNHGGFHGFDGRKWNYRLLDDGVSFMLTSPDGDGGYPGTINVEATYRWSDDCRLELHVVARTDRPTLFNPTCHAYFNLSADQQSTIADHELLLDADKVLETDSFHIPRGWLADVDATPFDFRHSRPLGNYRYNHCYDVCSAKLTEPHTRRSLFVTTSLPGIVLYTSGWSPRPFEAVCLETQFWPDAIHFPSFLQPILRPHEIYDHTTVYHFC